MNALATPIFRGRIPQRVRAPAPAAPRVRTLPPVAKRRARRAAQGPTRPPAAPARAPAAQAANTKGPRAKLPAARAPAGTRAPAAVRSPPRAPAAPTQPQPRPFARPAASAPTNPTPQPPPATPASKGFTARLRVWPRLRGTALRAHTRRPVRFSVFDLCGLFALWLSASWAPPDGTQ
jgi:hypothetical protein